MLYVILFLNFKFFYLIDYNIFNGQDPERDTASKYHPEKAGAIKIKYEDKNEGCDENKANANDT